MGTQALEAGAFMTKLRYQIQSYARCKRDINVIKIKCLGKPCLKSVKKVAIKQ